MLIRSIPIVLLLLFAGCAEKRQQKPYDILREDTYLNLMIELQMLDALVFTSDTTIAADSLKRELFSKYEVDQAMYDHSDAYYRKDIEQHRVRLDSALRMLKKEQQRLALIQDSLRSEAMN